MTQHCATAVPADHPALVGHFPGNPLVPGVVLVSLAESAARELVGAGARLVRLPVLKFLQPLRPDEPFAIRVEADRVDGMVVKFTIAVVADSNQTIATGTLHFSR